MSKPKPVAQKLPGQGSTPAPPSIVSKPTPTPAAAAFKANGSNRTVPAPPRASVAPPPPPPPPPPSQPAAELYKAKYAFNGEEGEMSLKKDDIVEIVTKEGDNGWWLVKMDGVEGWAPTNYLELVPPQAAAPPAPKPPPRARPAPAASAAKTPIQSVTANASAKPVSVFPGMAPANGSAAPWKKSLAVAPDDSPASSRPPSVVGNKPALPPIANKPKPPVGAKPAPPKAPGKPPIPSAPRPPVGGAPRAVGGGAKPPAAPGGQMDLAAAVSFRLLVSINTDFNCRM